MPTDDELRVMRERFRRDQTVIDALQHQRILAPQFGEAGNAGGTTVYQLIRTQATLDAAHRSYRLARRAD